MLSQQESAWAVYASTFLFFTIFLTLRCRKNFLLIPFVIFGMILAIGTICLLAAHFNYFKNNNNQQEEFQESSSDRYWQSKSLAIGLLPASSILILMGIMEAQMIYIRHMAIAMNNRDHWGSIYLRDPEKSKGFLQQHKKKSSLRPWTYWCSLVVSTLYLVVVIICVIIQTTTHNNLAVSLCITLLTLLACFNLVIVFSATKQRRKTIRQNRDDLLFLRMTPIWFTLFMIGMMMLSWIYTSGVVIPLAAWIVLESFCTYLPLVVIFVMCIYTGKIQTMGRQYPIEAAQQREYSYKYVQSKVSHYEDSTILKA